MWQSFKKATTTDLADELQRHGLSSDDPDACRLRACVILGGYGDGFTPGARCGVLFDNAGVRVTPDDGEPLELPYEQVTSLEVGGPGLVRSGDGFFGGGFGVQGAAEGVALASALNSLTSTASIETILNIKARKRGVIVAYAQETPDKLRIRMAGVLARVEGAQQDRDPARTSASDELTRLHELHTKGILTDDEYASAKAKLIEHM